GQPRPLAVSGEPVWDSGVTAGKALKSHPTSTVEVEGVGDFEKDHPFTCSIWLKSPRKDSTGAVVARMDEANGYRGWDLWLDRGRPATHIVSKWPDEALKVIGKKPLAPDKWHYVTIVYDGGASAESVKLFVNGIAQDVEVAANSLKNSIRTAVPLKLAQRSSGSRVDDLTLQDLRIYDRALQSSEIVQMVGATRAA